MPGPAQDTWTRLRAEMDVVERWIYLDHAAVSPLPRSTRAAMKGYLDVLGHDGRADYPAFVQRIATRMRTLGGRLLNAPPEHVFAIRSTTQGLGIAATGLPVRAGDNVVLVDREFPANQRPWLPLRRKGVEVRFVPQRDGRVRIEDLAEAIDARTAAVSVSFVQFLSGFRLELGPVAELCRKHDALFVVDAIQGLGVFPLDVEREGVDLLAADSHKWMLGPEGAGLGYASKRALDRIEPALEGWLAVERPFDFFDREQPLSQTASRYEEGAFNLVGLSGMNASLELLLGPGTDAVARRLLSLTDGLCDRLAAAGWTVVSPRATESEKSGIVLATRPSLDADALAARAKAAGIIVSVRGGAVRFAPHVYTTEDELNRAVAVVSRGV